MDAALEPAQVSPGRWSWPTLVHNERLLSGLLLIVILLLALGLRTYRLPDLMQVGGDPARDALVVEHMLQTGEPVLQGPIASIGTYHRGPAYYYLLAVSYWLSGGDPIGGALLSVALDLAALVMAFVIVREICGPGAGLATASLWAVSPILIFFARSQWNPQAMIFFALLSIFAVMRIARGEARWLLVLAPAWLIAWQVHEPALFLAPMLGLILAWRWRAWFRPRLVLGALALSGLVLLPFLVQQLNHRFEDVRAMLDYVLGAVSGTGPPAAVPSIVDRVTSALGWLPRALPGPDAANVVLICLGVVGLAWSIWRVINQRSPENVVLVLFSCTPLLYGVWQAPFYAHYLLLIEPVPLILAGVGVTAVLRVGARWLPPPAKLWPVAAAGLAVVVAGSAVGTVTATANTHPESRRWVNELAVARQIIADAHGQSFAFRLQTDLEPFISWEPMWEYPFVYIGSPPDPLRVDLPTYVIFDPADYDGGALYGGHVVDGIRWVAFATPSFGASLLSDAWQFGGQGTGALDNASPQTTIRLTVRLPHKYSDAVQTIPVTPLTRYLVRYDYRTDAGVDGVSGYLQVLNADGNLVTTLPTGAGNRHEPAAEWTTASFMGQIPVTGASARVVLRGRGTGNVWFTNVRLQPVVDDRAPWREP